MIDLIKFFQILFLSPKISRERLKLFAETHIQRLTINNPGGVFNSILATVTAAYTNYFGDVVDASTVAASLKSLNQSLAAAQLSVLEKIRELEPLITYTYRLTPAVYLEFYPTGLGEYTQATNAEFETLSLRFANKLNLHSADLPATEIADYDARQDTYAKAIVDKQQAEGQVAGERSDIGLSKNELCSSLTQNVLTIALHFLGNESKADVYFDQSIIRAAFTDNNTAEGDINDAETQNAFSNTKKPDTQYRGKVTGEGGVRIGFMATEEEAVPEGYGALLEPGHDWALFTAAAIGYSSDKKFLNVTNASGVTTTYVIERV